MRSNIFILIAGLLFILLTDAALYIQLKQYLHKRRNLLFFWIHSLLFVSILIIYHITVPSIKGPEAYFWISKIIGIMFLFYSPKVIFILINTIGWLSGLLNHRLKTVFRITGISLAGILFLVILYSITLGRYNFKTETTEIGFSQLPPSFNHFKIVQLSDMHLGSHDKNYKGVSILVDKVNSLKPDIILFTGDMVNNFASEMSPWIEKLSQLNAKYGKFAVTGNHDYGDYTQWESPEKKQENLSHFFRNMEYMGFKMLNNANTPLIIGQDTIYIAGVENWGKPPFPRYGKLSLALEDINGKFTILLSHDPSHWQAEVLQHPVPLTLSGHTHAMQMGIKIGNKEWSPAKYIYPEYDGLYTKNGQYLYVSRGQGFLGFPGRIGLRPEISTLVLVRDTTKK